MPGERSGADRCHGIRAVARGPRERPKREQAGADEQGLRDGGVLDGVLVGRRAVGDEVDLGRVGEHAEPVTQAGELEPRAEEAGGLGALAGADENDHGSSLPRAA